MGRKKTIKASVRYRQDNYKVVRAIADVVYGGDFSKAANFVIESYRKQEQFAKTLELLTCMAEYNNGVRTKRVIEGKKNLEALISFLLNGDKNVKDAHG